MKLTIRHVHDFGAARGAVGGDLSAPGAWDAVRDIPGAFRLPDRRMDWEAIAEGEGLDLRARDIVAITRECGAASVASYGVGTGILELRIATADPDLAVHCTDSAPQTVARLASIFTEANVVRHDLRTDAPLQVDFHLMHRLDAELADDEWRLAFERFEQPILFVPNLLLDMMTVAKQLARRVVSPKATKAGWYRNEPALRALWAASHDDRPRVVGGAPAFLLARREVG